jgi:hypothetical protein
MEQKFGGANLDNRGQFESDGQNRALIGDVYETMIPEK